MRSKRRNLIKKSYFITEWIFRTYYDDQVNFFGETSWMNVVSTLMLIRKELDVLNFRNINQNNSLNRTIYTERIEPERFQKHLMG
jgi:hypothetical protein